MRTYRVNVNGVNYEVMVEEIDGAAAASAPAPAPAAKPAAPAAPAPVAAPAGSEYIKAPMPGSILSINKKVGDTVRVGSILMILEAMKMENEITSPVSGTVMAVNVGVGSQVNTGDVLMVIA